MKSVKRSVSMCLAALTIIMTVTPLLAGSVYAYDVNTTVKVGFFNFPGYHEMENEVKSGYGYDFLALLQRYTNLNYDYVGYDCSWDEMQQMLLDGDIDLVTSARKTAEREKLFDFSEPIGANSAMINVRIDDERFIPGDYEALNNITIGELKGNSRNQDVANFAKEKGFTYSCIEYDTASELQQALLNKQVDAIATSSLRKSSGEKTVAEFAPQEFYCIVRKGDTRLLMELNYGISQMDINEGNWRDDLYYKNYESDHSNTLNFTQKEKEYIEAVRKGEKTITATAQTDGNPYSYLENGELVGIIPDYFEHLMEMAQLPYKTVIAQDRTEFHEWVIGNHTDVVMDFRFGSIIPEMENFGLVTDPYLELTTSRVTRKGFVGTPMKVAVVESWGINGVEADFSEDTTTETFATREEAMKAVNDGRADVCYVYTYTAEKYINTDPDSNLQSTILKNPVYDEFIYVSPDSDHELCSILNKCIKADASGALDEYVKKYTTVTYDSINFLLYLKLHPALVLIGVAILVLLFSFFILNVFRVRVANLRNDQLENELVSQQKLKEALTFTDYFLDTYISAYYVDLNNFSCQIYKRTVELERDYPIDTDYLESITKYINKDVHPDDREELLNIIQPENMRNTLVENSEYAHSFRDISDGVEKIYKMQVIRGQDENHAAFGFADISDEIKEQRQRLLGAVPLSLDVLSKANIGLWAFEIDKGTAPRMYVDDTMLGLIGLQHQVSPEETYHAWYDHIDKDSYELVNDAVDKMMSGEHAEVQYPWHQPDGRIMIVRCGGVRNPDYTKGIRIEGTHQNVTAVLHFDEEQQKREQEELTLMLVSSLSDAYASMYYVTAETGEYQLITRDNEFGNKVNVHLEHGGNFYNDSQKSVPRVIFAEDYPKMKPFESRENMETALAGNDSFAVDYRLMIDDEPVWYRVKTVKIQGSNDELYYAVGIMSIQEQLEKEKQLQKNRDIIEILASEYTSVYYIDLVTDDLTPYTMNESTESAFGSIFRNGISYSDAFRMYVDEQVLADDKELMLDAGSVRNIMRELRSKKTFITTYRDANGHFSEMKFVKVGDETGKPIAVALGFADKDAELRAQKEAAIVHQRNQDIIAILASEYSSVYYIDLTTDELDPYTMNEETETEFGHIFRSGINYSDAFKMYVETLVYSEDKAMMLEAGSLFNILKELSDKKTFITTYRSDNNGEPHYCEMKFVKVGDDDNPQAVALGFADKDSVIRAELLQKEIAARDAAVISGLSDDFGCVVYVNYETGEEVHYRFDPLLSAKIPGWEGINVFDERIKTLAQTAIHPDDKYFFNNPVESKKIILETVNKEGVYYRTFRVVIDDEISYYQLKIVKDENSDTHVIAGLRNVDDTAKRELEYQEKLEVANKSKTDFLFNMSHDIRTPMNAIIGFTKLAKKYIDNKARTIDSLNKIESSGNHLLELINEVLDMSRVEAGKLHSDLKTVNVSDAAMRLVTISKENAAQRNINLEYKEEGIVHPIVLADELHINQIIMNILGNAIKYTMPGGRVCYSIKEETSSVPGYAKFVLAVEDTGVGMSPEFLEHIFESFSREDKASTSQIQGTGLGMSIVKRLVDFMDGTIDIESEQGKGTKVTVVFQLKIADAQVIQEQSEESINLNLSGKKVLLVEDNDLNREIAIDILEEQGMIIDEAINGMEAIKAVNDHGSDYYDFVLMDIQMPLMDGFETTAQIRKLPGSDKLPIIALSANAFEEDKEKSLAAGMNAHVSKPIVISELMAALADFVG